MTEPSYESTLHDTLIELLRRDERVVLIGEWERAGNGRSVHDEFGPERIVCPPVSELGYAGVAVGAALSGLRPIVSFGRASFMLNAWEQVVNEASHLRYRTGGQSSVPVVFYCVAGARGSGGAQHSHSVQAALWNTPGLKVALPSTPAALRGLLRAAVDDPDPVVVLDHERLRSMRWANEFVSQPASLGAAVVVRGGDDITIVATSYLLACAHAAADTLLADGIGAELIDPCTLVPFDETTVMASVRKTRRVVVADESHLSCGVGAEIAARVTYGAHGSLAAPVERVATLDAPIPYSRTLESVIVPGTAQIVEAARRAMAYGQ